MTLPKYAIREQERRFLLDPDALPPLSDPDAWLIEDLYVRSSRLRLRAMTAFDGTAPVFKLCKKYPDDDPRGGPIVNIYLSATEYDLLAGLPGRRLRKRRHRLDDQAAPFHVDVFEGALAGLVISEVETADSVALAAISSPAWAVREITADPFFNGDNLARLDAAALDRRLRRELSRSSRAEEGATP
ncbi:MAG: hypothetical protein M3464_20310 [Chloroflexota bacterium]|nr:hypothetical protein [Chloroflexota bacterium]